jgi:hypothetical protein
MTMQILSGLSNGQVLQRLGSKGATVTLAGTASEDAPIRATLFKAGAALRGWKAKAAGKIVHGKFSIKLSGIPAGGPYRLRLEAGAGRAEIGSFLVGDVWILAGQSNMEGIANMSGCAKPHPLIRAFSMRREWRLAEDPLHVLAESPDVCHTAVPCSPERGEELRRDAVKGVGVGLFFAREMLERSGGVPQGLICAAHGGTSMQQWNPARKHLGGKSLYASMLTSVGVTGQPVAGVLWYQGESDANPEDAAEYTTRMQKLAAASRRDLRLPRLPWIIVQIARHFTDPMDPRGWNSIQEHQRLLPSKIKFFETVAAIDLPMDDSIHVGAAGFPKLATRLARAADRLVYGNRREMRPPQLRGIHEGGLPPFYAVDVSFDSVKGGLRADGEPAGFMLVAQDGTPRNQIYGISLHGDTARLHIGTKPRGGFQLWYGHGRAPRCNITDARGCSLPVFGPISVDRAQLKALTPFVCQWRVSPIVPITKKLDQLPLPDMEALGAGTKTYFSEGFIDEHGTWQGKPGHAFFHSRLHLSEPMKLEFLMGYDGPFRLWLDGKPFFANMKGTNPCFPDESGKTMALKAGTHDIHIGMDLNDGRAWGFFLRFARKDVTRAQTRTGEFVKPTYSI